MGRPRQHAAPPHPGFVLVFNLNPVFDPIRDDPRFAELAERVKFPIAPPTTTPAPLEAAGRD